MDLMNRIERLRNILAAENLDGALISNPSNVYYLSGFDGGESMLVLTRSGQTLVTDSRFTTQAGAQAPLYNIFTYPDKMADGLKKVIDGYGIRRLGYEAGNLSQEKFAEYSELFKLDFMNGIDTPMNGFRARKDAEELDRIRKASEIADAAFVHILKFIRPGMTEFEVSAELEHNMKQAGASAMSFPLIVAAGERAAMPHASPSERVIAAGDVLTLDFGCVYKNYCSDTTRTIFIGKPKPELRRIYETVLAAQLAGLAAAKAGMNGADVDMAARNLINAAGYEGKFIHSLGHGVGIDIHESPVVSNKRESLLTENMVITIEPGIYVEGLGGVRIEDSVVVLPNGVENLNKTSKELIVL